MGEKGLYQGQTGPLQDCWTRQHVSRSNVQTPRLLKKKEKGSVS